VLAGAHYAEPDLAEEDLAQIRTLVPITAG
jgi:hypothetical protein